MSTQATSEGAMWKCPIEIKEALRRYVDDHIEPGGFLRAVLENDLSAAIARADDLNMRCLPGILRYVYWEMPSSSWGTPAAVARWLTVEPTS